MATDPRKRSVLGTGLKLAGSDLCFEQGDLALVAGRDNFLQAMNVMIETQLGSDIFNVNYGFDLLGILQSPQPASQTKELIRLNIVKSVSQDPRVREITAIIFDDEPRFFEILPDQSSDEHRRLQKTERRWQAIVVLETITEGEVVLRLDGKGLRT